MTIYRDDTLLNPKFARRVKRLTEYLIDAYEVKRTKTLFQVFESYRTPERQASLLRKGTSKSGPFQSAHQFGLAVDFVPYLSSEEALRLGDHLGERVFPGWNWNSSHDYDFLATAAKTFGLATPISWDRCHVEDPNFKEVRKLWRKHFE